MADNTCSVIDCGKQVRGSTGYCYAHYMKNWRYGTPTPDHGPRFQDIVGKRFGLLTVESRSEGRWRCVCECGERSVVRIGDLNRGTVQSCGASFHRMVEAPSYNAAHQRVREKHGSASNHPCVDCFNPASHWSYDHKDPEEIISEKSGVPYSPKVDHYEPRCVSCHKRFDLDYLKSTNFA